MYGVFGASESNSRGKGPVDLDGYAWWYFLGEYKYNIKAVTSSNATMPESIMPWSNYNEGFALQSQSPPWSIASKAPTAYEENRENAMVVYELVAGWPATSWYGAAYDSGSDGAKFKWSFLLVRQSGGNAIIYPYQPMRGLFMNAIVLGVPAYLSIYILKHGFVRVREYVRRRRGLCPHCAYDISNLTTCPECGQEVTTKPKIKHS